MQPSGKNLDSVCSNTSPQNITDRKHSSLSKKTDAAHGDVEDHSDSPPHERPSPVHDYPKPRFNNMKEEDDFIEVTIEPTPSPTASDILARTSLDNLLELTSLNTDMREQGLSSRTRKHRLLELKEQRRSQRKSLRRREHREDFVDDGNLVEGHIAEDCVKRH